MEYEIVLAWSEEGYSACCPALPGCWSQGAAEDEARENIASAIQEYLEAVRDLAVGN